MICRYETRENVPRLSLRGNWCLPTLSVIERALGTVLTARAIPSPLVLDAAQLDRIDTAGALLLCSTLARLGVDPLSPGQVQWSGWQDAHRGIVDLVCRHLPATADGSPARAAALPQRDPAAPPLPDPAGAAANDRSGTTDGFGPASSASRFFAPVAFGRRQTGFPFEPIGRKIAESWHFVTDTISWFGRILAALAQAVRQPRRLRPRELVAQLGQVCVSAVPVIALVSFLIGLVIAYLLGLQATQYGANIFVVDGVALGLAREFSPLIVAVILAGRSGSAFAAQLGTMRLTEEIDVIRMLGLSVDQVLLVPRVVSLVLALPLLVFVANLVGMLGAMTIADRMLDIGPAQFLERLQMALDPRHLIIGLTKAPVFALSIAVVGCRMGMTVPRDARSIGRHTTSTVVQAIVSVIVLDALFAVLLQELGW